MIKKLMKYIVSAALLFGFAVIGNDTRKIEAASGDTIYTFNGENVTDTNVKATYGYYSFGHTYIGKNVPWFTTFGSKPSGNAFTFGSTTNSTQNGRLKLNYGIYEDDEEQAEEYRIINAIATTMESGISDLYYAALVANADFRNVGKITITSKTSSYAVGSLQVICSQDGGMTYSKIGSKHDFVKGQALNLTFDFGTIQGDARFAFVIYYNGNITVHGSNTVQILSPVISFIEGQTKTAAEIATENLNADIAYITDLVAAKQNTEVGQSTPTTSPIPTLPTKGVNKAPNGSDVTWSTSNGDFASVNASTGFVTVGVSFNSSNRSVTLSAYLSNTVNTTTKDNYGNEFKFTFNVEYVNPNQGFTLTFPGFDCTMPEQTGEVYLPVLTGSDVPKGKVFVGWTEIGTGLVVKKGNSYSVVGDSSFTPNFENNYLNIDTLVSMKLNYSRRVELTNTSTIYEYISLVSGSAPYAEGLDCSTSIGFDAKLLTTIPYKNNASSTPARSNTGLRLYPDSQASVSKTNGSSLVITSLEENIKSVRIVFTNGSPANATYAITPSTGSKVSGLAVSNGTVNHSFNTTSVTISNISTADTQIFISSIYIEVDYNIYTVGDTTGLRFSTTFGDGTINATKAGVLVIPSELIPAKYNGSIASHYLADGSTNVNSQIFEIEASNRIEDGTKLSFAGVIENYPSNHYGTELTAVCYYELDGQIYFSKERKISLKEAAQTYISRASELGLSKYQVAVLKILAK